MHLFEVDKHLNLTIDPILYTLGPFKKLWDRDKSKNKYIAKQEIAFVYFNNDYKSTFFEEPDTEVREKLVTEFLFEDHPKWKPDPLVRAAEDFYRQQRETFSLRLLQDIMYGLNQLRKQFREPDADMKKFVDTVEKVPKLLAALEQVEKRIKKEQESGNTLKGGKEKSMYADGD